MVYVGYDPQVAYVRPIVDDSERFSCRLELRHNLSCFENRPTRDGYNVFRARKGTVNLSPRVLLALVS